MKQRDLELRNTKRKEERGYARQERNVCLAVSGKTNDGDDENSDDIADDQY